MLRPLAAFALCFLSIGPQLFAQNPPPAPNPPAGNPPGGNPPPPAPPAPIVDDTGNAAKVVQQYEKQLADKDAQKRIDALAVFTVHRSESYVKLLAPLLHDKDVKVATAAVAALGNQPFAPSIDALLNYACDDKKGAPNAELRNAAIKALGDTGIGKRGYERLHETFRAVDDDGKLQIFETFAKVKEKRAFSMMVDYLDQPVFGGANQPPAAVQKVAFDTWKKCTGTVHKALRDMTSEGFPTSKQYIEWSKEKGAKQGFVYERGK